ncbi:GNAT family N-acetyltransferase [Pseudoroseicyclus sp. CLL3-39]|uniref:GNAT family N-acetyltransferase n=1 Tax=Pseudoroseicyclus tamaricis TaxID=2705421 RepID=A0A6B2JMQ7_9RHOB|nr:GNAT family N-acetyltransferase [Pseudoroseicyclus tamaricis]NDV02881.1 GNAT family N-acetyltransferase [Pseudoroseicyclus tamaricis]
MEPARLYDVIEATWPPLATERRGGWTIRRGGGGGSRVSAATLEGAPGGIDEAEAAMRALGQHPLVMIRAGQEALDEELAARGYAVKDPVVTWAAPPAELAARTDVTGRWPPGPEAEAIWAAGGIGPERVAVMARAAGPKVALLAKEAGSPAGTAFVAMDDDIAMLHALEVLAANRRRGLARRLVQAAAGWAEAEGASLLTLLVTRANGGANALYSGLGMAELGGYHYREAPR